MSKGKIPTRTGFINLTGRKFNDLAVLGYTGKDKNYNSKWHCRCDCGNECTVLGLNLKNNNTKSCGCASIGRLVKDNPMSNGEFKDDYLKECFNYNPETGVCFWLLRPLTHFASDGAFLSWNARFNGSEIGVKMNRGYLFIGLSGNYLLHRLICNWMGKNTKGKQVDHINGDKTDNRWCNLRLVMPKENLRNKKLRCSNKTGLSGVSYIKHIIKKPFRVSYYKDGESKATFISTETLFEAACIRKSFENKNGYHSNHGRKESIILK